MSKYDSKQLLRKQQKTLGGYFILPHPVVILLFLLLHIADVCLLFSAVSRAPLTVHPSLSDE